MKRTDLAKNEVLEEEVLCENFKKALSLRRTLIEKLQYTPRLYVGTTGNVRIHVDIRARKPEQVRQIVHSISKFGKCRLEKQVSTCGFLRYQTHVDGVPLTVNTSECFDGGKPAFIVGRPRTHAYCKRPKKEEQ
jgi:hypothetical protein